jgi:phosphoglycolate phosphatase
MTHSPFAIIGFDLDGTLLDTGEDLAAAVNHALAAIGRATLPVARIRPMIGLGGRHMMAQALAATGAYDQATLEAALEPMFAYYERHLSVHSAPYPGCIAALDTLAAQGTTLAVVTNKREAFALPLLRATGLIDRFACIIGGDTLGPGITKPSPAPIHAMIARCGGGSAAFVGDTVHDVQAARAAGVASIAVTFGFRDRPVEDLGADATIDAYDQLIPALARLSAISSTGAAPA